MTVKTMAEKAGTTARPTMLRHPLSAIFGTYVGTTKFRELLNSVLCHGQLHDIVTLHGMIMDGWHRYLAVLEVGLEPRYRQYSGYEEGALGYVVGANITRRQMSQSQYAMAAARLMRDGDGTEQKHNCETVCRMFAIGETSLLLAGRILRHGVPAIVALVESGAVGTKAAGRIVTGVSPDEQRSLAARGPAAVRARARMLANRTKVRASGSSPSPSPTPPPPPPALRPTVPVAPPPPAPVAVTPPPPAPQPPATPSPHHPPAGAVATTPPPQRPTALRTDDRLGDVAHDLKAIAGRIERLAGTPEGAKFARMARSLGLKWFDGSEFTGLNQAWRLLTIAAVQSKDPPLENLRQMLRD